eukprot:3898679-Ditylum_brightwellii.AAC.1
MAVQLGIPDIISDEVKTVSEIASKLEGKPNQEALLRTMRLLCSVGVFMEHSLPTEGQLVETAFSLSPAGVLLQTTTE